jgi:SagB-type dehydrogenase family enzyme
MDKLLWVLLPIAAAAAAVGVMAWRGRLPSRPVLNVGFSLLLLVYLLITAGLGLFWVANQHLPVFDWHYVFGYALLLLVVVHLGFNLRQVLFHLRRRPVAVAPPAKAGRRPVLGAFGLLSLGAAAGIGYLIGLRHGRTELRVSADAGAPAAAAAAVVETFHGFSAHSRSGVLRRASSADWGDPPPPFKTPPPGRTLPLPEARRAASPRQTTALDAAALADLLWHAAGVSARSGGIAFRTSPSSGALFATELYVLALRVDGVPAGLWHFDVPGHALAPVAAGAIDGDAFGTGPLPADTLALLVATAVFRRSGHKYRDRTYRYVLADLGHALENLRVVAGPHGAQPTLLPAFDEARMARALGIDEAQEGVLAAMLLQPAPAAALPALRPSAWSPPALAPDQPALLGLTDAIHRATSLRGAAPLPPAGHHPLRRTAQPVSAPLEPLPREPSRVTDPLALIARRRSLRRYANDPVPLADLAAMLAAMTAPGPLLSDALRIDFVARRVAGLAPGAWRYHPGPHALERRAGHGESDGDGLRQRARAAGLDQDVVGDAAVVFVLAIDRAALAADPLGAARGYRHAFIEAGLAGERIYLEAGARGLGVCAVGAFYDDEAAALVGNDSSREWIVHFAAMGRPA